MKLPTPTELNESWVDCPEESTGAWALRVIEKYVRLAEEEARREALDKAMSILRARSMLSSMHKTDCDAIRYSLQEIEALKAAPATAEAGKDEAKLDRIVETTRREYTPQPIERDTYDPPIGTEGAGSDGETARAEYAAAIERGRKDLAALESARSGISPPAPPPSKAVTEERVRRIAWEEAARLTTDITECFGGKHNELPHWDLNQARTEHMDLIRRVADLEAALDPQNTGPGIVAARSEAGGKTGEDDPMAVEREEMHKSMSAEACMKAWRRNFDRGREAGIREAVKWLRDDGSPSFAGELERALLRPAPAAREGSGA